MKYRTTQRDVKSGYKFVIAVGYCSLQNLLCRENETAYTTRQEGWAADIYDFGNTAIVTGYAPFGNVRPDYETVKKYDNKAEEIRAYYNFDYEKCKSRLRSLIREFIEEVTQCETVL